jgi:6-phosphogluconolactonase
VVINSEHKVISRIESLGDDPCHISMDNTGTFIVVTNYTSGSILIAKLENHKPVSVHSFITHEGNSTHP